MPNFGAVAADPFVRDHITVVGRRRFGLTPKATIR